MLVAIDGFGGNRFVLGDVFYIRGCLLSWVGLMGMTVIKGPDVLRYDGDKEPDKWGVTGTVIIAESHLAVHTWPGYGFVQVDLSSCKAFDAQKLETAVRRHLRLTRVETHVIQRGLHHQAERGALTLARLVS